MTHVRRSITFLCVAIGVLLAGCDKKDSSGKSKREGTKETAKQKQPLTEAFFGKTVSPPGALAKLKWAMPDAEARAAAPELFPKPDKDFQLADDATLDKVTYGVGIDKETKKLERMYVQVPADGPALIAKAWGPGKDAKDTIGRPRTYWFDAASGWRAYSEKGFGDDVNLEFHPYIPAAKLLGEGSDTLGFAPQGIVGATLEELRTRFGPLVVETDAAKAAEDQKKVGNFVGKDLSKELGPAQANVRLELPPTEWEQYWTRIGMHWSKDNKVETVWFKIPYGFYPPAKDELRAMFDKKWGAPKEEKEFGKTGDPIWIYRAKGPRIIVKDDTITNAWDIKVTSRAD
jgi:hypothetical protein